MSPARSIKRGPIVTDRSLPTACVATSIPRPAYEALCRRAEDMEMSNSAYLRELILADLGLAQ